MIPFKMEYPIITAEPSRYWLTIFVVRVFESVEFFFFLFNHFFKLNTLSFLYFISRIRILSLLSAISSLLLQTSSIATESLAATKLASELEMRDIID